MEKGRQVLKRIETHCNEELQCSKRLRFHIEEELSRQINEVESLKSNIEAVLTGHETYDPKTYRKTSLPKSKAS